MARQTLDAKGLLCPLPVLRARKVMKTLAVGDVLVVEATDPGAPRDFQAFCEATGNALLSSADSGGVFRLEIERRT